MRRPSLRRPDETSDETSGLDFIEICDIEIDATYADDSSMSQKMLLDYSRRSVPQAINPTHSLDYISDPRRGKNHSVQ